MVNRMMCAVWLLVLVGCADHPEEAQFQRKTFQEARAEHRPRFTYHGRAPQDWADERAPAGVREIQFPSGGLQLKAWVSDERTDGSKRPGVVFLHGGFAFGGEDWEDAAAFERAGYVLMVPMLRGENGNPGEYQLFYGELDDALAAGRYLASRADVDAKNVFVVGHSVGGTLAILTALQESPYRAAAAFSGAPDFESWIKYQPDLAPFDVNDPREIQVRSALQFAHSVRIPLYVFVERSGDSHEQGSIRFVDKAKAAGKSVELHQIPGDHFTMVSPSIEKTIALFNSLRAN